MCCESEGCQKPENLTGSPQECSPGQIRKCHGDVSDHPCVPETECEHPEKLKGKPGDCSPEQIRECHGEDAGHPCE